MKILIACEESQAVANEFRKLGHEAYSCDIEPCSGGHPEYHFQQDVIPLLKEKWDMIIAFPPCTHLAVSGARWFKQKREDGRQQQAIDFFMQFTDLDCPRVVIENSIGIMSTKWRKPDQIIQPWMFGHKETKATCLWIKGLPKLKETSNVKKWLALMPKKEKHAVWYMSPGPYRSKLRSRTYIGIAKAMASQYG